jgi:TolB-like protein
MRQRQPRAHPAARPPRRRALLALAALALAQGGCAQFYYGDRAAPGQRAGVDLLAASYAGADALLAQAALDPAQPVLVATVVNVDRLDEAARLGRVLAEQLAARLVQRGQRVSEPRLRQALAMRPGQGELLLSRQAREVSQAQAAQAVLVGTYAVSAYHVYVSLKLVDGASGAVRAAHDYALALDAELRSLLAAQ